MADTPDFAKLMQDAATAFKFDPANMTGALKASAGYGEKLSQLALDAAGQSAELTAQFTRETLAKLGEVAKVKEAPADYGQAMSAFAQAQAELMNQQMTAFAEIARKVQAETVDLMMSAANQASAEAGEAVRKAGEGLKAPKSK